MPATLNICLTAIIDNNRILLIRRRKPPYQGYRGMPGGKIKFGETITQTALREATEETGLSFEVVRICGTATENILAQTGEIEAHFVIFVVLLRVVDGELRASREGKLVWTGISELDQPDIIPSDRMMLRKFVLSGVEIPAPHFIVQRRAETFCLLP